MKLRFLAGPQQGRVLDIPPTGLIIGRDPNSDLTIDHDDVSRRHALLRCHPIFEIEDLGSTNGVRVNGHRIAGTHSLVNGDRIGIGDCILLFTDEKAIKEASEVTVLATRSRPGEAGRPRRPVLIVSVVAVLLLAGGLTWLLWPKGSTPPAATSDLPLVDRTPDHQPANPPPPHPADAHHPVAGQDDSPTPPQSPMPPTILHFVVTSEPSGATFTLDGQPAGRTPAILTHLTPGIHEVELNLPGYLPHSRVFNPGASQRSVSYTLERAPGTCRITSEPSGASVLLGKRLLGRTPFVLAGLPPGERTIQLASFGYQTTDLTVTIDPFRPTDAHAIMKSALGSLRISTLPAEAEIALDDTVMGRTADAPAEAWQSPPLDLPGIVAGRHRLTATFAGRTSLPIEVTVLPGEPREAVLCVYLPSTTLTLTDGRQVHGMAARKLPDGHLEFWTAPDRAQAVPADRFTVIEFMPYDEYLRLQPPPEQAP